MIFFLIPVFNEEKNIGRLYTETVSYMRDTCADDFTFIFVDDGSTDDSLRIIRELFVEYGKIIVLSHFPNAGVRRSFLDGFREFLKVGESGDVLITKEADNTSDNGILMRMIHSVTIDGFDIALASCYAHGGGLESTTFSRKYLSSCANMLIKLRFKLWGLYTFSSFYRAFSYDCLNEAFQRSSRIMTSDGFTCVVEMLIKLHVMGFEIKEIPMILRSSERAGESKMPIIKTIKGYLHLCFFGLQ